MNRRQQITVTCAAIALLAGLLFWATRPRAPMYQGKPITEWIAELEKAQLYDGHPAWKAIQAIGPKAVPYLLSTIDRSLDESRTYLWARSILPDSVRGQLPLSIVPIEERNLGWKAFGALAKLGSDASEAVPKLEAWLGYHDRLVAEKTKASLGRRYDESVAIAAVAGSYQMGSAMIRRQAADTLGKIGPGAIAALPSLIGALKDTDVEVRVGVAVAISALGPGAVEANKALIAALNDPDVRVRVYAARSLAMIGHIDSQAQPALLNLLSQTNRFAHSAAAVALWRMEPANSEALARVAGCLQDEAQRIPTMFLLGKAGPVALEFLPLVHNLLTNEDLKARHFATNTIKSIDPDAAAKAGIKQ